MATTASKGYVQIDAATGVGRTDQLPAAGGSGTVTSVSVTTAAGVSGTVANATTTPAITVTLGAITPTSVSTGDTTIGGNTTYTPLVNNSLTGANQRIPSHVTSNLVFTNASLTSLASANNGGVTGGHTLCITNATGAAITIVNNYGSAAAGEAILTGVGGDLTLPNNTTLWLQYNATGSVWACVNSGLIPIATGVSGLGTNVATFLATPSSANLAAALTDETGTGAAVFGTSPTITGGAITMLTSFGVKSTAAAYSMKIANVTALTADRTLTIDIGDAARALSILGGQITFNNAFTTGGNAITLTTTNTTNVTLPTSGTLYGTATGSITSLQLLTSLSDETGTGAAVFGTAPTMSNVTSDKLTLNGAGSTTVPQLTFSGATNNWIDLGIVGSAAPAFTTRSAGTRLVLYNAVAAGSVDFGFGIEGGAMWSSVGQTSSDFKWYGGTTLAMTLNGAGQLLLVGAIVGTATQSVFNTVSTTVNAFGSATTLNIGASSGTTTIANNVVLSSGKTLTMTGVNINVGSDANYDMWSRGTGAGLTRIANGTTGQVLRATTSGAQTWTPLSRTGTTTSSATPTINTDNVEFYDLTAQAVDITSFTTNLSGSPVKGQKLWIAITGTAARAITWGTSFEASTIALPDTTVTTARLDVGFIWNDATSKWRCIGKA